MNGTSQDATLNLALYYCRLVKWMTGEVSVEIQTNHFDKRAGF